MKISNRIRTVDLGLYLEKHKTLVIADLHLGYEEAFYKKGVLLPKFQFKDIYERIEKILSSIKVETVVITGDFKHEFGVINDSEWKNIKQVIELILKYCNKLIIIKGNHDVTLPWITSKLNIEVQEYYKIDNIFICHGDDVIDNEGMKKATTVIIGHEHPAIGFRDKTKYEFYKCFLFGKYLDKELIVLPSFNTLTIGTDVLRSKLISPFLQQDLKNFKAFVVNQEKVYDFGKLNDIK